MSYHAILTLVFFTTFLAMAGWVYRPGRKQHYQSLADIPLEETPQDDNADQGKRR